MNLVDFVILFIFFGSTCIGLMRGLTREVLSLASWGISLTLTYLFHPSVKPLVNAYVTNSSLADIITAGALLVAFMIVASLISHSLTHAIRRSFLGGIDRSFGLIFGLSRALLMICGMEVAISLFIPRGAHAKILKEAYFAPFVYSASDTLRHFIPTSLYETLQAQAAKHQGAVTSLQVAAQSSGSPSAEPADPAVAKPIAPPVAGEKIAGSPETFPSPPAPPPAPPSSPEEKVVPASSTDKVQALAQLKPQLSPQKEGGRSQDNKKQQQELDRLVQVLGGEDDDG